MKRTRITNFATIGAFLAAASLPVLADENMPYCDPEAAPPICWTIIYLYNSIADEAQAGDACEAQCDGLIDKKIRGIDFEGVVSSGVQYSVLCKPGKVKLDSGGRPTICDPQPGPFHLVTRTHLVGTAACPVCVWE